MSNFEIFLIVTACSIPVFAVIMLLPKIKLKFKKKEKQISVETKTYAEIKAEDKASEPKVEEKPREVKKFVSSGEISTDDFRSYLNRRKSVSKPSRLEMPDDFVDRTMPYSSRRRRIENKKPQSVAEEIQNLSPELKAMIIAGVLDKKDFD